eukprot:1191764-Prorocentrum_minimum.AAC.4
MNKVLLRRGLVGAAGFPMCEQPVEESLWHVRTKCKHEQMVAMKSGWVGADERRGGDSATAADATPTVRRCEASRVVRWEPPLQSAELLL